MRKNWAVFLGIDQPGGAFWHVLLPSLYKPSSDGYDWSHLVVTHAKNTAVSNHDENNVKMTADTSIAVSSAAAAAGDDERIKTE